VQSVRYRTQLSHAATVVENKSMRTIEELSGRPDAFDAKWTAFSYACKRHIAVSQLAEMPARNRPYGYAVESRQSDADFIKTHCWNWPTKVGRER